MQRVVCPVCRSGFEANISRGNVAVNCINCKVAFNASRFLGKEPPAIKIGGVVVAKPDVAPAAPPTVEPVSRSIQALSDRGAANDGVSFSPPSQLVVHVPGAGDSNGKPKAIKLTVPSHILKEVAGNTPRAKIDPNYEAARQEIAKAASEMEPPAPLSPASEDIIPEPPTPMIPRWDPPKDAMTEPEPAPVPAPAVEPVASSAPEPEPAPEIAKPIDDSVHVPTLAEEQDQYDGDLPEAPIIDTGTDMDAAPKDVETADDDTPDEDETSDIDEPSDDSVDSPSQCLPGSAESVVPPAPVAAAPVVEAPKPEVEPKKEAEPKKKSRRPILEGAFGSYDIEGEIARGGVGAVFRAKERGTGKLVALKVLLEGDEAGETERERFRHECETARALSLPGMVQVYEVGEFDGRPYMAMELVNGRSLDKVIPEKSLSIQDCLVMMKSVAETVGALHEAGYVHRDLKPGNILIDAFGSPKVADFGLVKSVDEITRLTASGLVCGTPAYMSPEQARGDGKAVDPRSDVWALGAVLYEMLTGHPPFKAENALRLMVKITKEDPSPPRVLNLKVPGDVQAIVMRCLEKGAHRRYQNGRALGEDIGRFLAGEPMEVNKQPRVHRLFAAAAQHRNKILAGVATIGLVAGLYFGVRAMMAPKEAGPLVEAGFAALSDRNLPLSETERIEKAEKSFRDALGIQPKTGKAYLGLGICLGRKSIDIEKAVIRDKKLIGQAIEYIAKARELDPKLSAECFVQMARFQMWLKNHAAEAAELENAVELEPMALRYREALGMAYWNAGFKDPERALDYYKSAINCFRYIKNQSPEYPKVGEYIKLISERFLVQPNTRASLVNNRRREK